MANIEIRDGDASEKFLSASGAGTNGDPFVPVHALGAGEAHIGEIALRSRMVTGNFTRPANTTGYVADDIMNDSTTAPTALFVDACVRANAGYGQLVGVMVVDSANQTTKADLELWIFNDSYTPPNDNAAFAPSDAEVEDKLVAVIRLGGSPFVGNAGSAGAGNCVYQWSADPGRGGIPFKCAASSQKLYYALVHRTAFTPISGEKYTVKFFVVQE